MGFWKEGVGVGYFIRVEDDVSVFVEDINPSAKKTIVFLHGWLANHNIFEYQFDYIPTYKQGNNSKHTFSGTRIKRGLYRTKKTLLNADINAAANIVRKVVPKAFANGIAAVCSQPQVVNVR
ncbi:hypothetical protein [Sporosarcina sp. G11-34]|uniref:alpha/beta fold hydrolase n=1 Tax=Sporosarcina sp. G11-34 TaxID=2849605 RepID=UPI003FA7331B|nr:hypothetical protein [Sporosarcina sp. G11-34]